MIFRHFISPESELPLKDHRSARRNAVIRQEKTRCCVVVVVILCFLALKVKLFLCSLSIFRDFICACLLTIYPRIVNRFNNKNGNICGTVFNVGPDLAQNDEAEPTQVFAILK